MLLNQVSVIVGNIVDENVDAIVNAANRELIPGGGVDGAIHRAAGRELIEAKRCLGGCNPGEAKHTESYGLKAPFIIHTVAPKYHPIFEYSEDKEVLLASCYISALSLAESLDLRCMSFPALGTGVYGWSHETASKIAMRTIAGWLRNTSFPIQVRYVVTNEEVAATYQRAWEEASKNNQENKV